MTPGPSTGPAAWQPPQSGYPATQYQRWNSNFSGCGYKMNQVGLPELGRPWHHWPAYGGQKPPEGALQLNERIVTFQIVAGLLRGLGAESMLATPASLACCSLWTALSPAVLPACPSQYTEPGFSTSGFFCSEPLFSPPFSRQDFLSGVKTGGGCFPLSSPVDFSVLHLPQHPQMLRMPQLIMMLGAEDRRALPMRRRPMWAMVRRACILAPHFYTLSGSVCPWRCI